MTALAVSINFDRTALHQAAGDNDVAEIKNLLFLGFNVDVRDGDDNTPLLVAAKENQKESHFNAIETLLRSGADVNLQDKQYRSTPLDFISRRANLKTVRLLLDYDANVNLKNCNGRNPLFEAIIGCDFKVIQLLIDHGSDVNCDKFGTTPLHLACSNAKLKTIKYFLRNGADVCMNTRNARRCTSFFGDLTALNNYTEKILEYLLKYSDVNVVDFEGNNVL